MLNVYNPTKLQALVGKAIAYLLWGHQWYKHWSSCCPSTVERRQTLYWGRLQLSVVYTEPNPDGVAMLSYFAWQQLTSAWNAVLDYYKGEETLEHLLFRVQINLGEYYWEKEEGK